MKTVFIQKWGNPEVATVTQIERPVPGEGELLVKVFASSLNPVDWKSMKGYLSSMLTLPFSPGLDLAGTVEELGPNVSGFEVGEDVYGMISLRGGAFAEYAVVKQAEIAKKPASLTYEQAAAVPLAALTAWQALFDTLKVTAGQSVLIHAAAGGVGTFAVQFAHNIGARVIGTASTNNLDFVRSLGADEVIDYTSTRFEDQIKEVDAVLDAVGGDTLERSYGVIKSGGILTTIVGQLDEAKAASLGIKVVGTFTHPAPAQLNQITDLINSGKVKVEVSQILPFSEVQQALQISMDGHIRGKLVLKIV